MITYYNYPIPSLFPFIYFFSMERRKYYKHIQKAKDQPEKYLSVIIDSMDQSKTQLPHFLYKSNFTGNMWKLRVT